MPRHGPIPRHAPSWWPADESWPPSKHAPNWWVNYGRRGQDWHTTRRRFLWRVGLGMGLVMLIAVAAGAVLSWMTAGVLGIINSEQPAFIFWRIPVGIILAGVFVAVIMTMRTLRRAAVPVAELMEAAKRVEAGDYTVRVQVRGPREVREMVQAFNEMVGRLQENEEQRRSMLSDVTHELRTPLTVIQGNLEGLLDGIYPRDDEHLSLILDETRVFARLVEDLRTLAQAEGGTLKLQCEPADLGSLIRDTLASFKSQADSAGVALVARVDGDLPTLMIDSVRIHAVLANLLVNALRYTPSGGSITVSAQSNPQQQRVTVMVTDTGKGIDPAILPHIFDRFYKSSDSHGSGLGLAIARHLVNAHGGEIKAENMVGRGTRITFTLPA